MNNRVFGVHFNPFAFLLPNTPFNASVFHNIPSPLFSVVLLMKAHFIHGFQYFLFITFFTFLATSAFTLETGAALFLPVCPSAPILLFQ